MSLAGPDGNELKVFRHFSDGIMMMDPAKIVVYDVAGKAVAETDYCRDVIVHRTSPCSIRVFGIDLLSGLFNQTWDFDGKGFVERRGRPWRVLAALASLWHRCVGYAMAVSCSVYGMTAFLAHVRAEGLFDMPGFRAWLGPLSLLCVFMYTPLSLVTVLILSLLVSVPLSGDSTEALVWTGLYGGGCVLFLIFGQVIRSIPGPADGHAV
jgi:hypothetical protein